MKVKAGGPHRLLRGQRRNNDPLKRQITSQYVRQELLLDIASWISKEFYDKCKSVVLNYFVSQFQTMDQSLLENKLKEIKQLSNTIIEKDSVIAEKDDKFDELIRLKKLQEERSKRQEEERQKDREMLYRRGIMLREIGIHLEDVSCQNNELLEKVDDQTQQLTTIQHKLEISVEDRAPQPPRPQKREWFILIKQDSEFDPYYTIRAQEINANSALRRQQALFTEVSILLDITCHPNSKTIYVRVKDRFQGKEIIFNRCKISLEGSEITETDLVEAMNSINDERANV